MSMNLIVVIRHLLIILTLVNGVVFYPTPLCRQFYLGSVFNQFYINRIGIDKDESI